MYKSAERHNGMCNASSKWNLYWWELPPFVERLNVSLHEHEFQVHEGGSGDARGIMLDMLASSVRLCCSSNVSITIGKSRQFDNQEQMLTNLTELNTIAMPMMLPTSVASSNPTTMFIRMLDNTGTFIELFLATFESVKSAAGEILQSIGSCSLKYSSEQLELFELAIFY